MYDLVASDFDLTLQPMGSPLGTRTRLAISRIQGLGVRFVVATGRATRGIITSLASNGIELQGIHVISYNGAAVARAWDGSHLLSRPIDAGLASQILGAARELRRGIPVEVVIPDGTEVYTDSVEAPFAAHEADVNAMDVRRVANLAACGLAPHKILTGGQPGVLREFAAELSERFNDAAEFSFSAPFMLEITAKGVDKGTALAALCAELGIDPARTVAIGDNHNDIPMVRSAGLGVAVGNGVDELKAVAQRVIAPCEDEGPADLLDELFPPNPPPASVAGRHTNSPDDRSKK